MTYSREMGPLVPGICQECQSPTGDNGTLCYTCRRLAIEAETRGPDAKPFLSAEPFLPGDELGGPDEFQP